MRRLLLIALVLSVALPLTSCRGKIEKIAHNIHVEEIERIEPIGMTGFEVVLRVKNDTGYKLVLDKAKLDLYFAKRRVGTISLREKVEVPRRTTGSIGTQWRIKVSDPLALFALRGKIRKEDIALVAVSFAVEGRGGPVPVNFSRKMMPLSEFLDIFGVDNQDIINLLRE